MADLSNLLGDVYGDDDGEENAGHGPAAADKDAPPAWADESVLDAAFANWTPGPPPDAPAAEHEVFATHTDPAGAAPLPDDLAAALSEALVGAPASPAPVPPVPEAPPVDPAAVEAPGSWAELAASRRSLVEGSDPFAEAASLAGHLPWQRGDDDILPRRSTSSRRPRGGMNLSFRRR